MHMQWVCPRTMHCIRSNSSGTHTATRSQAVARIADRTLPYSRLWSSNRLLLNSISSCCQDMALSVLGSRVWPFRVTWRHRTCDHSIPCKPFHVGGHWEASISNGFRDIQWRILRNGWYGLKLTTSKQRSRSFILVLIDFSYTTSYRLPIVTFALWRTVSPQYIRHRQTTDGRHIAA